MYLNNINCSQNQSSNLRTKWNAVWAKKNVPFFLGHIVCATSLPICNVSNNISRITFLTIINYTITGITGTWTKFKTRTILQMFKSKDNLIKNFKSNEQVTTLHQLHEWINWMNYRIYILTIKPSRVKIRSTTTVTWVG